MGVAAKGNGLQPLEGGRFLMGSDRHYPEERPRRPVEVEAYSISTTAVTNSEFAAFVADTGYLTTAEIPIDPSSAPDMPPEYFEPGSLVFHMTDGPVDLRDFRQWWRFVPGACWRHPEGPDSDLDGRNDHPVVHVSLIDAMAYARWAGLRLPSEPEWEFAANGDATTEFPWGDDLTPGGEIHANTWQGDFPYRNTRPEERTLTDPVTAFRPNGFGLRNMIGNVWEWTTTKFTATASSSPCCTPGGEVREGEVFAVKGGSFLCAPSYCRRYRAAARSPQEARSSTCHLGFRCAADQAK